MPSQPNTPQDFQKAKPKKAKPQAVTSTSQWKKGAGAKATDVELPSGNVAKIKQIPMPTLLADDIFPDSLRGFIQEAIGGKKDKVEEIISEEQMNKLATDPAQIADMFAVFDKVALLAIVEPKVLPAPADEADRDDDLLYIDEVDLDDKAFIFQFCVGGSSDLERFRAESTLAVGGMAAISSLPSTS